jgi:hypothetical protein
VTRLLALADISLDPAVGVVIKAGTVASTLLRGLDHGPHDVLRPLVEAAAAGNPDDAMPGLVLVLVAEGRDGSLVACCRLFRPPMSWLMVSKAAYLC